MAKAFFLRDAQLKRLRQNISPNVKRYALDKPWLADYFGSDQWHLPSNIDLLEVRSCGIRRAGRTTFQTVSFSIL